jgi:WD40 repeat protein/predicted Ser/Thr protein kinase
MAVAEAHPSVEELAAFTLGTLGDKPQASIEEHVAACSSCQERAAVAPADTLVELLRSVHAGTSRGADTAVEAEEQTPSPLPPVAVTDALALAVTPARSDRSEVPDALPLALAGHERYRVVRLLGAGGMGAVYEAEHRVMERSVALKVINRAYTVSAAALERFRREVRAAARLSHPNIVTTYDAEDAGETHFLVMEYVDGTDLGRLVQEHGLLPVDRACDYVRQAALGLQHAFEQGMVHRDLKPHNLMLTPDGRVKILDFGLARFASEAADAAGLTSTGIVLGTVDYIAPEQADNAHQADIRSDIYSLGCTLYHLLAGQPPFPRGTALQKVLAHVEKKPQPLTELCPDLPEGMMPVLERMMAKDPTHRYQTPAEVAFALEPFLRATAVTAAPRRPARTTDPGRTVTLDKKPERDRKRPRFAIAAAVLAWFVAGLLGVGVYRIATDKGELVITTESDDVKVVVTQGGKLVEVIDTKTDKQIRLALRSGEYELELMGAPEGLKLTIDKATLTRGKETLAKIERIGKTPAVPPVETVGEIRRFEGHTREVWHVALSADGRLALSVGADQTARLWKVATGEQLYCFEGMREDNLGVVFSPDSKTAFCSSGGEVRSWDVATGKERETLRSQPDCGRIRSLAISADGRKLLAGGIHAAVLFDIQTGKELQRLDKSGWIHCAALSPDATQILTGADGLHFGPPLMRLWDAKTGQEIRRFAGHTKIIHDVAFSPDGKRCVSCGSYGDSTLRVFDLASGKELLSIPHPDGLQRGAFLPDGRGFFTTCNDGVLYLWDVRNGQKLHSFNGHTPLLNAVAVSRDGRYVLSGGNDRTVRLWRLPELSPAKENP